jgi:hypothetical protein
MNTRSATLGNPRSLTYTVDSGSPCSACRRLINAVIFEDFDNKDLWGKGNKRWKLFFKLHYTKLSEIRESAEACELCDLIAEHWPAFEEEEEEEEEEDGEDPNFWIGAQPAGSGDRPGTKSFLVGTLWDDDEEEGQRFELFHKRDPDLLDAAEVIEAGIADVQHSDKPSFIRAWNTEKYSRMRTEPYPYSGSDECFQLAAKWMNQCTNTHGACARNNGDFFPKRVLDTAPGVRMGNRTHTRTGLRTGYCWS